MSFISNIQKNGRQINSKVTILGTTPIVLESDNIFKLDKLFEADFFRTSMTQIDGELKGRYDLTDKIIKIELGVSFDGSAYDYINFGEFVVKEHERVVGNTPEFDKTVFKAFDKMILFHKIYNVVELGISYPISVFNLLNALAISVGLTLDNVSIVNGSLMIDEDKWTNIENVTYRNILDEIAQVSASTIIISGNKLKTKYVGSSVIDLYEENLRKLKIENKYGGVNILNLTREPQHDNYVYPLNWETIPINNRVEVVFENNQIMDKNRENFAPALFNSVNGLQFYPFEAETVGIAFLEPLDAIVVIDMNNISHSTYVMHSRLIISSGLRETLKAVVPMYAKKEYALVTDVKKENSRIGFLIDKQNLQISAFVSDFEELDERVTENESSIIQNANQIALRVSQTDLNNQLSNYSTITQTANDITLAVGTSVGGQESIIAYTQATWEQGGLSNTTGLPFVDSVLIRTIDFIPVLSSTNYIIEIPTTLSVSSSIIYFYTSTNTFISVTNFSGFERIITTPSNASFIKIRLAKSNLSAFPLSEMPNHFVRVKLIPKFLNGARYNFDGTNATFTNGGLIIKNNANQDVFTADVNGNLVLSGNVTATSGAIGRFNINGNDLVYTSELFNKTYDQSDVIKLHRIILGFIPITPYDLNVYDLNNSGNLSVTDLVILSNHVSGGQALPTPRKRIRSIIRIGTTSGEIRTTSITESGALGDSFVISSDKIVGDLLDVKNISTNGFSIENRMIVDGIEDSGSNINGSWTRYSNGEMECWHSISLSSFSTTTAIGSMFYNSTIQIWSLPVPFINNNYSVFGKLQRVSADRIIDVHGRTATTTTWGFIISSATSQSLTLTISLYAKGRWK